MRSCRLKFLATAAVFAGAVAFAGVPPALATDPVPGEFEINDDAAPPGGEEDAAGAAFTANI